jgi:hypothetical protein
VFLAFLGIAGILLAGPLLAFISLLLALAFIGVLIWLPMQFLTKKGVLPISQNATVHDAARTCEFFLADAKRKIGQVRQSVCIGLSRLVTAAIEIVSGMAVGVLLLWVGTPDAQPDSPAMATSALLGGIAGIITATARFKSTESLIVSEEALSN